MECTYCFLQSYLTFPYLVVYVNLDDLFRELRQRFAAEPDRVFRVGTGELADSLALDHLTGYGRSLVEFFAAQRNAILELKTKTDMVDNLLGLRHNRRTILAWSVNPPEIARLEELKTSSLPRRLAAASRCGEAGYPIGFHFDPLVHYPNWASDYREVVDRVFAAVPPEQVAWISLGGLRMPAAQRQGIKERFPHSSLPYGELIPAEDGKLRYFKGIRLEMYRSLLFWIKEHAPSARVYTCMERPEVWRRVFGGTAPTNRELNDYLTSEWAPAGKSESDRSDKSEGSGKLPLTPHRRPGS
jgi:spore photoproduct lyase